MAVPFEQAGWDLFEISCRVAFIAGLIIFKFETGWTAVGGITLSGAGAVMWIWDEESLQEPQEAAWTGYQIKRIELVAAELSPGKMRPHKLQIYKIFTNARRPLQDRIVLHKASLGNASIDEIEIPANWKWPQIVSCEGNFQYPPSTDQEVHWTANFGHCNVFPYCRGLAFNESELQVAEHPALMHVQTALEKNRELADMAHLEAGSALLIEGAFRYGSVDISMPIDRLGRTLYGNHFAWATEIDVASAIRRSYDTQESKIFVIPAPRIHPDLEGEPYTLDTLREIARTAYAAFKGIIDISSSENRPKVVIHTGNWGCETSGNDEATQAAIVLMMAFAAGIDEVRYHPMGFDEDWDFAIEILRFIQHQNPLGINIGSFLSTLLANVSNWELFYRRAQDV